MLAAPALQKLERPSKEDHAEVEELQRRVAAEAAAKEDARVRLDGLVRELESTVSRLKSGCYDAQTLFSTFSPGRRSSEAAAEKCLRYVDTFRSEVQERLLQAKSGPQASTTARAYDVLRQSLTSAQKRCSALNEDMLRVADGNEELMNSFQVVKETNRRLVEQIQTQSEEIGRVTQLRLQEEAAFEDFVKGLSLEKEQRQQHAQERQADRIAQCEATFHAQQRQMTEKLQVARAALRSMAAQLSTLRQLRSRLAQDVRAELTGFKEQVLKQIGRRISDGLTKQQQQQAEELARVEGDADALVIRLAATRQAALKEMEAWTSRGKELDDDRRVLATRASEEAGRLARELAATEVSRQEVMRASSEDFTKNSEEARRRATNIASCNLALEEAKGQSEALEARCRQLKEEKLRLEEEYRASSQQLHESDHALNRSLAINQSLRQDMEGQSQHASKACCGALEAAENGFQKRAADLCREQRQELDRFEHRLQELSAELAEQMSKAASLEMQESSREGDRSRLEREHAMWKSQHELAVKLTQEVEQERRKLCHVWETEQKEMKLQQAEVESKVKMLQSELGDSMTALEIHQKEIDHVTAETWRRAELLESQIREVELTLVPVRQALQKTTAAVSVAREEVGGQRSLTLDSHNQMHKQLADLACETAQARTRLESELALQRDRLARAQAQCEEYRRQAMPVTMEPSDSVPLLRQLRQEADAERHAADAAEAEVLEAQRLLDDQEQRFQELQSSRPAGYSSTSARRRLEMDASLEAPDILRDSNRQLGQIVASTRERFGVDLDQQRQSFNAAHDGHRHLASLSARNSIEDSLSRMRSRTDQLRRDLLLPGTSAQRSLDLGR